MAKTDLLQGTLDLLVLRILTLGQNHGWGIFNSEALDFRAASEFFGQVCREPVRSGHRPAQAVLSADISRHVGI